MIPGIDCLGAPKYKDAILHSFPTGWAFGCFSNVFGDALPTIEALIQAQKSDTFRLHLSWKDNHDFSRSDFSAIEHEAKRVAPIILKHPDKKFYISGACEHDLNNADALELSHVVKAAMPSTITYVNCGMVSQLDGVVDERHGTHAKPINGVNIFSFDGQSCHDADITRIKALYAAAQTDIFFFWDWRDNGHWNANDTTPRPDRKGWPDRTDIESTYYLWNDKGQTSLPNRWTLKSHSENKGPDPHTGIIDPRAEKPCLITPLKVNQVVLKAKNGHIIAMASRYRDPLSDGRWRYYFVDMGYIIAEKARNISGNPVTDVFINGKKYGSVNCAFRENENR